MNSFMIGTSFLFLPRACPQCNCAYIIQSAAAVSQGGIQQNKKNRAPPDKKIGGERRSPPCFGSALYEAVQSGEVGSGLCEEYGIYRTTKELEHFVDSAPESETEEDFDREEYLRDKTDDKPVDIDEDYEVYGDEPEDFRPMEFEDYPRR